MSRGRFKILILPSAARALRAIRDAAQDRIRAAIRQLADDPTPVDSVPMHGKATGLHRVRVGAMRVVYRVQTERRSVLVLRIGHRREVYRGFER